MTISGEKKSPELENCGVFNTVLTSAENWMGEAYTYIMWLMRTDEWVCLSKQVKEKLLNHLFLHLIQSFGF